MQGGRNPFSGFGDPFGSFGGQRGFLSSVFGETDPFDDPFFTRPFGASFESMAGSGFFGSAGGPFMNPLASGFLEHHLPQPNTSRGPVIEELSSDDEKGEEDSGVDKKDNPRKHGRSSKEPFVEYPDEQIAEKRSKYIPPYRSEVNQMQRAMPQPLSHSFTFHSSTVSYGGANGTYYSSSRTRRAGSDGLTFEECKEADASTGQATHRVSRGIDEKGHSVTKNLKSDGHVDTMQTLHNLNEDELVGFEEAWKGNAGNVFGGWRQGLPAQDVLSGPGSRPNRAGRALPSTERLNTHGSLKPDVGQWSGPLPRHPGKRIKPDLNNGMGSTSFRSKGSGSTNQVNRF